MFCDVSCVLTLISSARYQRSMIDKASISMSFGNLLLSLVAGLKNCSNASSVSSMPKKVFIVLVSKKVCFVKEAHLSPFSNSKTEYI